MTVLRGFLIVVLSGVVCSLAGAALGYALAVTVPGYYRGVFSTGREAWFDPVAVGLGLGLTQGLIVGLIVGAMVVLAVALYNSRRSAWGMHFPTGKAPSLPRAIEPHAQGDTGIAIRSER